MASSTQTTSTTSHQVFYYRLQILRGKIDDQLRDEEAYVKLNTKDPGQIYQFLSTYHFTTTFCLYHLYHPHHHSIITC